MLPDWFNNIVAPILLSVTIACMIGVCVALCLWIRSEIKPKKGDDKKCR